MGVSKENLAGGKTAWRARSYDKATKKMVSLGTYPTKKQAKEVFEARKALEHSNASELTKAPTTPFIPTVAHTRDPFFGTGELQSVEPPRKTFAQRLKDLFRI